MNIEQKQNEKASFKPENLKRWVRPQYYMGEEWYEYYGSGVGQHRDSNALDRSNFRAMLQALGGESDTVIVVREGHWAVGWVEWIAIHESDVEALREADKQMSRLENYPILDEEDFSNEEMEEANEIWKNCYRPGERVEYIREHRSQFEFHSFTDLRAVVRGEYFNGYANELID